MRAVLIPRDSMVGVVAGPLVWAAHFLLCYITVAVACASGLETAAGAHWGAARLLLIALSAVAVAVTAGLGALNYRRWQRASGPARHRRGADGWPHEQARHRFMALAALLLASLSGIAIVYVSVPLFVLSTCQ